MKRAARKLKSADYRTLAEFRLLLRRFLTFSEEAARKSGLSPQQHQALLAIKGFAGDQTPTVGDLASHLHVRHHSAVGMVNRLAKAGYLRREHHKADRRRVGLSLTPAGEKLLARLTAAHRDELRMITPSLQKLFAKLGK